MRKLCALAGLGLVMTVLPVVADPLLMGGDPEAGEGKSAPCAACHMGDGNSANPEWPKLAGQHADYTFGQLLAYQEGNRQDPVMNAQVINLSEQDMKDLAAFYSLQTPMPGSADPELAALGERIYRGGNRDSGVTACIACHGPRGEGVPLANYPRIGGQHAQYLRQELREYRAGERRTDRAAMMREIAARMTDEEIEAVAEYIQGLY
jgi:cytochrome c553